MRPLVLILLYIAVTLAPLAISVSSGMTPRSPGDELAAGLGMTAFAMILVEFVLSGRFRLVSRRIGADVTMRMHQLLARTALVFALLHPFFYQAPFAPAHPWDTQRGETLYYGIDFLATGTVAWVLLIPFVLLAIARDGLPFRYETWRALHGGGAALIAAFAGYHTLIGGRYSAEPALSALWLVLIAAAFVSLAVVYVVKPLMQLRHPYRVKAVRAVAERTVEVELCPEPGHEALGFKAGQFAWLNIGHSPFSIRENPFSISSCPAERPRICFLIKEVGDFTPRPAGGRAGHRRLPGRAARTPDDRRAQRAGRRADRGRG